MYVSDYAKASKKGPRELEARTALSSDGIAISGAATAVVGQVSFLCETRAYLLCSTVHISLLSAARYNGPRRTHTQGQFYETTAPCVPITAPVPP